MNHTSAEKEIKNRYIVKKKKEEEEEEEEVNTC
jgi:hypothetical protein